MCWWWKDAVPNRTVRESVAGKVTFAQRHEEGEKVGVWGESQAGRRNSRRKGPEVGG